MAFSNKQQINSMESSVNTLAETKQNILNDTNKNEVSLLKLTATNLYAGIFYYLGQPLEQLLGNKQNLLSNNTDVDLRQVSCTNLTVNDSNIVSAINLKQNIIDTTKDVQMRNLTCNDVQMQNLTCNSVGIKGIDVISSLNAKQYIIQDGDLTIDRTTGLQKTFDDLNVVLDTKQDIISSSTELSLKSLTVGGSDFVSIQAIGPGPPSESPNIGEIQCESLIINYGLNVEEKLNEHTTSLSSLEEQINDNTISLSSLANEKQDTISSDIDLDVKSLDVAGRMTVTSSGNIGIGTTSPAYQNHIVGQTNFGNIVDSNGIRLVIGANSNGNPHHVDCYGTSTLHFNYFSQLNVGVPSLSYTSDDRIKENKADISNATKTLLKLRPQIYNKYKNFDCSGDFTVESGLIAQEVYYQAHELRHIVNLNRDASGNEMIPDEVTLNTDYDIHNDLDYEKMGWGEGIVSINYTDLIPYLIKSVQELEKRVVELEK